MRILLLLALVTVLLAVNPPLYDYAYHITFDEAFTINKTVYRVNGQTFYDPKNNRERVDRVNGRYDLFCGTVIPNVTTACQQITVENKRWLVFPQRSQCCFCCDSAHGCGILKADWLADAEYKGQDRIIDTMYDKWSKDGKNVDMQVILATTISGRPSTTKSPGDWMKMERMSRITTPTPSTTRPSPSPIQLLPSHHTATSSRLPTVLWSLSVAS